MSDLKLSDKVVITEKDLEVMVELSKDTHGEKHTDVCKGVVSLIQYAELVSNL